MGHRDRVNDKVERWLMSDKRKQRHGWAPGDYYHSECRDCGKKFIGDKRAWQCADCAYAETEHE